MNRDGLKDYAKGIRIAIGFAASLSAMAFFGAFAAASWGSIPSATSWMTITSSAWNDVVSQLNALAGAMTVTSGDVSLASGKTLSAGKLQITDTVVAGTACSPTGTVSKDSSGTPLSCKAGVWMTMWSVGPQGPAGPTGATGPQGPAGTNCWAPQVEIGSCRGSFHTVEMTACDWRTCNSCGCWSWNPGWRQILLQNPWY